MTAPDHAGDFATGLGDTGLSGVAPVMHWHDDYMANVSPPPVADFNSGLGDTHLGGAQAPYND